MTEKFQASCDAICQFIIEEHACVTVGAMGELTLDEMETALVIGGGSKKWVRSIEHYIGCTFVDTSKSISMPASAVLVSTARANSCESRGGKMETKFGEKRESLGAKLTRLGTLKQLKLPTADVRGCDHGDPRPDA